MRVVEIQHGDALRRIVTYLHQDEITALGGIPPEAVAGVLDGDDEFTPNAVFREFLHEIIGRVAPADPDMQRVAEAHGDGRLVFVDSRLPANIDPVPDEDIIGWFLVRAGAIVPGSYLPNSAHAIYGEFGWTAVATAMRPALIDALTRRQGA